MSKIINLQDYGYKQSETVQNGLIAGRITELQRERYTIITEQGEVSATLKGSFYYNAQIRDDLPCVGDFVLLQYNTSGISLIAEVLPRQTKFSRADFTGRSFGHIKSAYQQVVAANFDYVFIVTSLNHDFNVNRIIRYITQATQSGGKPIVILTKADLDSDYSQKVDEVQKLNLPVYAVSSHTGFGLAALSEYLLPRKTIVFLGMSGVGKSSLINALMGDSVMDVQQIRKDDSRGRHTTTHRQLFMLTSGAMVIDTPGMRELGLYDAEDAIKDVFSEIEELFAMCKFSNCNHETEPGCAVKLAIKNGTLTKKQWEQYLSQKRETRYIDDKTAYMRERREWGKSISKFTRKKRK
ncbi:MAG: ribosome small subunit-dependent GTPase A [Firmicutes bacterium]|nr:ribosome small subunit-dependent GTPase A [Bacillota bacterium]